MKVESVLQNCTGVVEYPYPHISIKNALSKEYYEELFRTLPSWKAAVKGDARRQNRQISNGARRNLSYEKIKQLSSVWNDFCEFHASNEFYQEWLYWFSPYVRKLLPKVEETYGNLENTAIGTGMDFIVMLCINGPMTETESIRPPHLDNPTKMGNGLLYMADPSDTFGGDLQIYECGGKPEHRIVPAKIKSGNVKFPIQKVASSVPYEPNRYVSFLCTPISVHGVAPRSKTNLTRTFFNTGVLCDKDIWTNL